MHIIITPLHKIVFIYDLIKLLGLDCYLKNLIYDLNTFVSLFFNCWQAMSIITIHALEVVDHPLEVSFSLLLWNGVF